MKFNGLTRSIIETNCKIHTFSSGGGLRVVGVSKADENAGYGEHPSLMEAFRHADEDYLAGGRPYKKVYGKLYDQYYTDSFMSDCAMDQFVKSGYNIDLKKSVDEKVFLTAHWTERIDIPKNIKNKILVNYETIFWNSDGRIFESKPEFFPSGDIGFSTKYILGPKSKLGNNEYQRDVKIGIIADTVDETLKLAEKELRSKYYDKLCSKAALPVSEFFGF